MGDESSFEGEVLSDHTSSSSKRPSRIRCRMIFACFSGSGEPYGITNPSPMISQKMSRTNHALIRSSQVWAVLVVVVLGIHLGKVPDRKRFGYHDFGCLDGLILFDC